MSTSLTNYNERFSEREIEQGEKLFNHLLNYELDSARSYLENLGFSKDLTINSVNYRNEDGVSALHLVAMNGESLMVDSLLERGAKPNLQDNLGRTALTYSIYSNKLQSTKYLLKKGANARVKDEHGIEAKDYATIHGNQELTSVIYEASEELKREGNKIGTVPHNLSQNHKESNFIKDLIERGQTRELEREFKYFDHLPKEMQEKYINTLKFYEAEIPPNKKDDYSLVNKLIDKHTAPDKYKLNHTFEALGEELKGIMPSDLLGQLERRVESVINAGSVTKFDNPIEKGTDLKLALLGKLDYNTGKVAEVLNEVFDELVVFDTIEVKKSNPYSKEQLTLEKLTYKIQDNKIFDKQIEGFSPITTIEKLSKEPLLNDLDQQRFTP